MCFESRLCQASTEQHAENVRTEESLCVRRPQPGQNLLRPITTFGQRRTPVGVSSCFIFVATFFNQKAP